MQRYLVLRPALAAQKLAQAIASGRDQLGGRELDDFVADECRVGAAEHALVREALQRAVVELHLGRASR
jgi:hypothetical protein